MAFKKKTWVDRMVEYAGRRKITNVTTMAAQIVDVERAEGVVSEEGTAINAVNMNDFEQRTADAFSAVQQDIEGINSDLADGQIEFDLQNGKGVYRQKGADTWLPFRQPIVIDAIYATYGASGMNVNGGGGVTGLNVEGYSKVSMGPFTYVKNRTFYISYTKKDGTVISHNKTASFTSFEFELVDAVKLSMYMSGFSAEAVSECKNIIIT